MKKLWEAVQNARLCRRLRCLVSRNDLYALLILVAENQLMVQTQIHDFVVATGAQLSDIAANVDKIVANPSTVALGPDDVQALDDGITAPLTALQAKVAALANPVPAPAPTPEPAPAPTSAP